MLTVLLPNRFGLSILRAPFMEWVQAVQGSLSIAAEPSRTHGELQPCKGLTFQTFQSKCSPAGELWHFILYHHYHFMTAGQAVCSELGDSSGQSEGCQHAISVSARSVACMCLLDMRTRGWSVARLCLLDMRTRGWSVARLCLLGMCTSSRSFTRPYMHEEHRRMAICLGRDGDVGLRSLGNLHCMCMQAWSPTVRQSILGEGMRSTKIWFRGQNWRVMFGKLSLFGLS